jgi:hypothetical protein
MAKEILDAEQLDSMWPTDASSEPDYADRMTRIEDSRRELRNQRTRVKTREDALDAYDGLVADAYKIRELGFDSQSSAFKAIGRAGTGNTQWNLPANFANAIIFIADHEGSQAFRNRVLDAEYGMSLEDDYKPLLKAHDSTLAVLRKEQAGTKLQAQMEQVRHTYESELDNIEGAE